MNTPVFSAPQQAVLDAIAQGATKTAAAQAANVHRDTINHWEHSVAGFRDALQHAQASCREELAAQLRRVSAKAIDRLEALLDDPTTPPTVLFRAIQFALTRPSFPQKEWALPENLNPPAIQQMQQSMAIIEGDYLAARQHDAIRKMTAGTVGNAGIGGSVGFVGSVGAHDAHLPPSRHVPIGFPVEASSDTHQTAPEMSDSSDLSEPRARPAFRRRPARNASCPCGSGMKYKGCCGIQTATVPARRRTA